MNRNQLHKILAAGVFSTAVMNGLAYANDKAPNTTESAAEQPALAPVAVSVGSVVASSASDTGTRRTTDAATTHRATSTKSSAEHSCAGAGGCGGGSMSDKSKK